jgi:hypothetical protein
VDDATARLFQEAGCKKNTPACGFPGNDVLYGSFTGANRTEAIVLSGIPMDCPCISIGELFSFIDGEWKQAGPFGGDNYTFILGDECYKMVASRSHEVLICIESFTESYDKFIDPEFFPTYALRIIDLSKLPVVTTLFSTHNMANNSLFCQNLKPDNRFKLLDNIQITFDDVNKDENLDISLDIRETEISSVQCGIWDGERGIMKLGGKPATRYELHWLFDGETFTPTPETQEFLNTLQTQ